MLHHYQELHFQQDLGPTEPLFLAKAVAIRAAQGYSLEVVEHSIMTEYELEKHHEDGGSSIHGMKRARIEDEQ